MGPGWGLEGLPQQRLARPNRVSALSAKCSKKGRSSTRSPLCPMVPRSRCKPSLGWVLREMVWESCFVLLSFNKVKRCCSPTGFRREANHHVPVRRARQVDELAFLLPNLYLKRQSILSRTKTRNQSSLLANNKTNLQSRKTEYTKDTRAWVAETRRDRI